MRHSNTRIWFNFQIFLVNLIVAGIAFGQKAEKELCTVVYESECTTRYEEYEVDEDVAVCNIVREEKCEDVTQGFSTEQRCTKLPVKKCEIKNQKTKKYSPHTACKKVPRELCGAGSAIGQRARQQRSLADVVPFKQQNETDQQEHHADEDHQADPARDSRQRSSGGNEIALDIGSIAAAGERCIDKVVMVEETEYDDVVICKHSYSEKCHTTYITDFRPQQQEECEENFVKKCFIEFKLVASEGTVTFCHTPIQLEGGGPEVCKVVYESECTIRYEEHDVDEDVAECSIVQEEKCEDVTQGYTTEQKCTKWPVKKCETKKQKTKKYSPQTECKKVPREVCGAGSIQVPGEEKCFDRKETAIQEVK